MTEIDTQRFLADLHELRQIGAYKTGVHRPTYSPQDMQARNWLVQKLAECGLDAEIDGIGNVMGRNRGPGPHVLAGSHIESQNYAGWLDGALGVVSALALARTGLPVEVVACADEEGHFDSGFMGSRSFIGELTEAEMDACRATADRTPLRDALATAGLAGRPRILIDPARYRGFFEMHIEQGTQLERQGLRAGVVTGIVAIWQYRIVFEGQQDHAGGTTMAERRDAGLSAVRLLAAIDQEFPRICGPRSVWTTGKIVVEPGAPSIIPGRCEILFQFRDLDMAVLERMHETLERLVADNNRRERCTATLTRIRRATPALCDPAMMAALEAESESRASGLWQTMPSGAGHDAQYFARVMPVAMLFTPSIGGISHHWAENTSDEDLALCCQILGGAVQRFLA